ncbi:hypothetical protein IAT40_007030 [Kwoniella sp. CBS 6097]
MSFLRSPLAPRHSHSPLKPYKRSNPSLPFEILLLLLAQDPHPSPSLLAKLCLLNSEVYILVLPYLYRKVTLDRLALSTFFWGIESKRPKVGRGSFVFKLPPELAHVPTHYVSSTEPLGLVHPTVQTRSGSRSDSPSAGSHSNSKSILRSDWKENMSRIVNHDANSSDNGRYGNGYGHVQRASRPPVEPCPATERRKRYALSLLQMLVLLDGGDTQVSEELGYIVNAPNPYPSPPKSKRKSKQVHPGDLDGNDHNDDIGDYDYGRRDVPDNLFICQSTTPLLASFALPSTDGVEPNIFRRFCSGSGFPTSPPASASAPAPASNSNPAANTAAGGTRSLLMPNVQRLVLHAEMLSNLAQWRFISPGQAKDHEFVQALQEMMGSSPTGTSSAPASNSDSDSNLVIEIRGSIAKLSEANLTNAMRYPKSTPTPLTARRLAAEILQKLCEKWRIKKLVWHDLGLGGPKSVDHLAWIKGVEHVEWHFVDPFANLTLEANGKGVTQTQVDEKQKVGPVDRASGIRAALIQDMWYHQDQGHQHQPQQQPQGVQHPSPPVQTQPQTSAGAASTTTIADSISHTRIPGRTRYTIIGAGTNILKLYTAETPILKEYEAQGVIANRVRIGSDDVGGGALNDDLWERVEWVASSEMNRSDFDVGPSRREGGGGCGCYPNLRPEPAKIKVDPNELDRLDTGGHGMRFEPLSEFVQNLSS